MQSNLLLMPKGRGSRKNNATRAELFGNRYKRSNHQNMYNTRTVQQEMAWQQAIAAEQASRATNVLISGQSVIQRATRNLLNDTRDIKKTTKDTLTVSKRIESGVKDIKSMLRTPGGAGSLMMNPFFALVVFFLSHPYLPVTVETIMPIWSILLSVNYVKRITTKIANGEAILSLDGGVLGIAKNMVFNAPHAIILMYKLSTLWAQERTGVRGYTAANAAAFSATMDPSNWEPFVASQFISGMETMRHFNLASLQNIPEIPRVNITEWQTYLESASNKVYSDIQQMDPELFKDRAGCIQLILEYAMGKLVVKGRDVASATLNMPAYLHQLRTVISVEQWIYECLFHLMKDIFTRFFKDLWMSIVGFLCGALCLYAPPPKIEMVGAGFGDWIASATGAVSSGFSSGYTKITGAVASSVSTVTSKLAEGASAAKTYAVESAMGTGTEYAGSLIGKIATWTCDCKKYGKVKMDGGTRKSKSKSGTRRSTKSRTYVPSDHADFILLSWRFVLFTLSPVLTGIPLLPTSPIQLTLDTEMRELLHKKVETGQFVPPILLRNVGIEGYLA